MKSLGIEKQALLVALIPVMMMTLLLSNYFIYSRFADLDEALIERSQMLVNQIASSSEYAVFSNNLELLEQDVDAVLTQQDVSKVLVLDASAKPLIGRVREGLGQSDKLREKVDANSPIYEDGDILILYKTIVAREIKLNDINLESSLNPEPAKTLGAVILEISKQRLESQRHHILVLSLLLTLMILAASIMLALRSARRISNPITAMSKVLHSFGEGNLDSRIEVLPKVPELFNLATGFNQMAQKLQQHQEILEITVAERTSALVASEQEYRTLIENAPDTIARYDTECRRIYVNPAFCELAGSSVANLLGKRPSESPVGANAEIYESKIKEVFETGENVLFELKWTGFDGKVICSHLRLTAERDMSGEIISVLSVGHDITELNETKNELQRKELAKSRFLAAAGHDLRQPLAAANLFIDALKFTSPSEKQRVLIGRLDQTMSNFNGLLDALLNVSKLDGGMIKPEYTTVPVAKIFDWIEESFTPAANKKQLRLSLHFPKKEMLAVRTDVGLLKSVLLNLISNAIKFTSKGGILVSARRRGDNLLVQVWDTGIGISNEHIKHIFDEFYQVSNPQRDKMQGLGLGLYIAKRSLGLFEGDISCRSRVARGSVFEFFVPLTETSNEVEQQIGAENFFDVAKQIAFVSGKNFVVIEDDILVADALGGVLRTMGGNVKVFLSAEEALDFINIEPADFYIVDYMLGGKLNGIQFLYEMRQKSFEPVKAIIVSGDTSTAFAREIEQCDWPVLHKPVNVAKLISMLAGM
jgi:PAS domain S-box-containing protein